jgi:hypothetical protein
MHPVLKIKYMLGKIYKKISNIPGWKTKRKIVVIESDDWGSIMMPSRKTFETLKKHGVNVGVSWESRYNLYDSLASSEDLIALYEVLESIKDKNNQHAKFTAVSLVANPDFEKIKDSGFTTYHYERFTDTLARYNRADAFELWKEGTEKGLFYPEFHGREHLNVQYWLRELQRNDAHTRIAFDNGMWGFNRGEGELSYQAAFDLDQASDVDEQHHIIEDGLNLFKQLHGYAAQFFVPPNGPINNRLEKTAAENGIKYMSSPKLQKEALGGGKTKMHFRYLGKKNKHNQIYITRNVFFEPSGEKNQVNRALEEIELAFKFKKPAVISSHRVNYIGVIDESNRTNSLKELKNLLTQVLKKWPDVEFMSSTELGDVIANFKFLDT